MKAGWWFCASVICSYLCFAYFHGQNVANWPEKVVIVWLLLAGLCWLNILIVSYLELKKRIDTAP